MIYSLTSDYGARIQGFSYVLLESAMTAIRPSASLAVAFVLAAAAIVVAVATPIISVAAQVIA